jgi:flavin reductase (DIM6/NTAB) family NADH-FMN oxidoreductase RutF
MKKEVSVSKSNTLINPGCVVLASVKDGEQSNIITLAWQTPLSIKPRLLGISVGFRRHSHDMILNAGEFVINVPGKKLLQEVHGCGTVSGRKTNKFEKYDLHKEPSKKVHSPGIQECLGIIECKLTNHFTTGDHTFFVGEVLHACAEENAYNFNENRWHDNDNGKLLFHLGADHYISGNNYLKPE